MAVDKWRSYLMHQEFVIRTDQQSVTHLEDQRLSTTWQQKAMTKMMGLQYRIAYKKGQDNRVADALSRHSHTTPETVHVISTCVPCWLEEVANGYQNDPQSRQLISKLAIGALENHFTLQQGVLCHKGRIWLGNNNTMQTKVIQALHNSAIGGHSGFAVTYHRIKKLFSWPSMKKQIQLFVRECKVCQQVKTERVKYPGILQPLPVPMGAWLTVTMDFINGLPHSKGFNCIMVVVDKFSNYSHFIPVAHPFTTAKIADVCMRSVYRLHGMPEIIVSDRDPVFTSNFSKELCKWEGTKLNFSTTNHPQTDGQTERVNQYVEAYIRYFVHGCPSKWASWIYLAEY